MLPMSDVAEKALPLRLPPPFGVHRSVLGSDHLHFGLWPVDRPAIPLEEAQQEMLQRLFSFLPPAPAAVLVVGCDLGLTAFRLAERGHAVTAIAASAVLAAAAADRHRHPGVAFHALDLFADDAAVLAPGSFAAVVLLESAAALAPLDRLLGRVRELLADGGTVALAGEIAGGRGGGSPAGLPTADDYTIALAERGFRPVEHELVGARVAPTCAVMAERLSAAWERAAGRASSEDERSALHEARDHWAVRGEAYAAGRLDYELRAARKDPYAIRPYAAGDEQEILTMFREVFGVERTLAHWRWKFLDSPWGARMIALAVSPAGEIVAHYAGYPVPFYQAGGRCREFLSRQIGDTMTRPSVRQAGLGKHGILARSAAYYYARFCGEVPFAYGFNTGHIRKLGERYLGYSYIDPVGYWVREPAAGSMRPTGRVARWLAGYSFAEITEATDELDELFVRVRDAYGFLVRRDAAYVGWRYLACPDRTHRVLAIRKRGRLVGWCAFARRGDALVWGDALIDRKHLAAVPWLLQHCATGPYRGVARIWAWFSPHPAWWTRFLVDAGFVLGREPAELTPGFYFLEHPEIKREIAASLYYTYGDSDLF